MELDELKQSWARMELRQQRTEALLTRNFRDQRLDQARSSMRRGLVGQAFEMVAWVLFVAFAASFWVEYRHVPHLLVIGLVLHVYGLAAIWSAATQLLLLTRIYRFDAPVTVVQRRLAQLRRFHFYSTLLLGLPWWCLWLLAAVAGAQWLFGVDLYASASPSWFWVTLGAGVMGMGVCLALARHLVRRPVSSPRLRRVIDDLSGYSLRRASRQLAEIASFERNDPGSIRSG